MPHVFNPTPVDSEFLGTIGWYRMHLTTPATPGGFGWQLRFEGARRTTYVWLNGKLLGRNVNPYEPFTLPAAALNPPGPGQHAGGEGLQPPRQEPARGLVELGRDHPARAPRAGRRGGVGGRRRPVGHGLLDQDGDRLPGRRPHRRHAHQPHGRPGHPAGLDQPDLAHRRRHHQDRPRPADPRRRARPLRLPRRPAGDAAAVVAAAPEPLRRPHRGPRGRDRDRGGHAPLRVPLHPRAQRPPLPQRPPSRRPRRLDPGGPPRPRPGPARGGHRHDRRRPRGARRERDPRAVPALGAPAGPARPGGHPGLEPGARLPRGRGAQDPRRPLRRARRRCARPSCTRATTRRS